MLLLVMHTFHIIFCYDGKKNESPVSFYMHDDEEDEHDDTQQDGMFYDVEMVYKVIH